MTTSSTSSRSSSHSISVEKKTPFFTDKRISTILLSACICGSGAAGLVNEYILSTVSTYVLGGAIEQFSIIIALMMLSMGVAGYIQQFFSDKNLIEKFIFIECSLAIIGSFAPMIIYFAFGYTETHFTLIQYTCVVLIGGLIGFEIPLLLRINKEYSNTLKANLAAILSFDYIGACLGAFVWVFFLLKTFPLTESSFLVSGSNFLIAMLAMVYFFKKDIIKKKKIIIVMATVTTLAIVIGYFNNREFNHLMEQKFYDDPIQFSETTKYQRLVITKNPTTGDTRLFINGNVQFSSLDEDRYHEMLVHPIMKLSENNKDVLVLGGGDGLALKRILDYKDVNSAMLVDLDPDMVKMSSTNELMKELNGNVFNDSRVYNLVNEGVTDESWRQIFLETNEKNENGDLITEGTDFVRTINIDADKFIENIYQYGNKWGTVIVDFPDPSSIEVNKLYTKEFYLKVKRIMPDNGMMVIQSTSPYHAKEAFLTILNTVRSTGMNAIPYHINIPAFGDWGYVLAWKDTSISEIDMINKIKSIQSFDVETDFITPDVLYASTVFGKGELESQFNEINTLMNPRLLTFYRDYSWVVD